MYGDCDKASNDFKLLKRIFFFKFLLLSMCILKKIYKNRHHESSFYRDETLVFASTSVKKNHFVFLGPEGVNFQ